MHLPKCKRFCKKTQSAFAQGQYKNNKTYKQKIHNKRRDKMLNMLIISLKLLLFDGIKSPVLRAILFF